MSSSIKLRCLDDSGDNIFLVDSMSGIYTTNTKESINASTGALLLYGGLSINNSTNSTSSTKGGALTISGGASFEKDVYIGGNLTVYGTQTQIISQTVNVYDNLIVINSSPITNRDAGILFQRYQIENDTGLGSIINDIPILSSDISSSTNSTAVLNSVANSLDDYYTNCFIKITSGLGINQVRKITGYIGLSRTITINTPWTTQPVNGTTFNIYNKVYASQYYKESSNNFTLAYTTSDPNSSNIIINDWIGMDLGSIQIFNTSECSGLGSGGSLTALGGASISKNLFVGGDVTMGNNVTIVSKLDTSNLSSTHITTSSANITGITTNSLYNISDVNIGSTLYFGIDNQHSRILTQTVGNLDQSEMLLFKGYSNANPDRIRLRAGALAFDTFNNTDGNHFTENIAMYIDSTGSIGINTTNPETQLDVNGIIRSSGGIDSSISDNTLGNLYTQNGNVGINIQTPSYHLDVNGNTHISGDLYIGGLISGGDSTSSTFSYLTLTSTDDAINQSTGSLVTFGGITIQTSTDATSITNGGSFLTPGGVSIGKRLFVGSGINSTWNSNTLGNIFTTGGNVGVGVVSPQSNLHININSQGSLQLGPSDINSIRLVGEDGNLSIYTGNSNIIQCVQNGNVGINTTNPLSQLDVNGTINASTSITTSSIYATRSTVSNSVFTNVSTSSIVVSNSSTIGNLFTISDKVGINNTSPLYNLDVNGSVYITSTNDIGDNNITSVSGGCLNINGNVVVGTSGIHFTPVGLGQPSFTTRSIGTKIVLSPELNSTNADYAFGLENSNMWYSSPNEHSGFKWYQGITNTMSLSSSGSVILYSTSNASGVGTGGTLTVNGGAAISKDIYIGGSLYVDNQNISSIFGNTHINSFSGTGVCIISNISIGKTMNNINYKVIGNLRSTTDNNNVYTVSFKKLTTTSFDAIIYRIDSLGSGWNDTNLYLSWQITP